MAAPRRGSRGDAGPGPDRGRRSLIRRVKDTCVDTQSSSSGTHRSGRTAHVALEGGAGGGDRWRDGRDSPC